MIRFPSVNQKLQPKGRRRGGERNNSHLVASHERLSHHHCQGVHMKTTAQKQQEENTTTEQALSNTEARRLGTLRHPARPRAGAQTTTRRWHCLGLRTTGTLGEGKAGSCTYLFSAFALSVQFPAGGHTFPCCTAYSTSWFQKHSILKGILLKALG